MIHVCYGIYDKNGRYSKFAGTSILSMFENTQSKVTVHILHDNTLTQDNRDKFIYIAGQYNQTIKFYNVEESCADKIAEMRRLIPAINNSPLSIGTLYRLLMLEIIPEDIKKILYFDSDTIINLNVDKLYKINFNVNPPPPLAAASEPEATGIPAEEYLPLCRDGFVKSEDYFNAGILVMNLEQIRKEQDNLREGISFRAAHPEHTSMDQEILNYCFASRAIKLPLDYNIQVYHSRSRGDLRTSNRILHYISLYKGIGVTADMNDSFSKLWWSYFAKTPWFNAEMIGRMYEGVRQIYAEQKGMMISLSAIMSGKTRAFFMLPNDIENMKKFFRIKSNEEIIPASGSESLNKLAESMRKSEGKKLYILLLPMYPYCREFLTKAGFEEGKDFINGFVFLSDAQGVPLNAYQIIKLM